MCLEMHVTAIIVLTIVLSSLHIFLSEDKKVVSEKPDSEKSQLGWDYVPVIPYFFSRQKAQKIETSQCVSGDEHNSHPCVDDRSLIIAYLLIQRQKCHLWKARLWKKSTWVRLCVCYPTILYSSKSPKNWKSQQMSGDACKSHPCVYDRSLVFAYLPI